ncbi:MAG: methylenetetrahydrofolate--tRNA-(uracil(54)-C(5))-methyltransferase (FADH(2)-oxidizing) TrmFO [Bdellovibrionales bacterium]|nr:methylenetetrahydrofolate--tRNA-(uracil(54)-C(5))-methyltransferase (FADH(2)-oxidizing) TrmFO [Bdellovibrionales bacterium]
MSKCVKIIGAGLAGSEAAWQLAERGVAVQLFEMRPKSMTKAHKTGSCAELVCSNSFRGADLSNAVGLLKAELREMKSLIMEAADATAVPAGGALAVDRVLFSKYIDERIRSHPLINFSEKEIEQLPEANPSEPLIVATGPLTSAPLASAIEKVTGSSSLAFFDAISPIVLGESLDMSQMYRASRYDKGDGDDYLNIPFSREQYYTFIDEVTRAEKFGGHDEVESDMVDNLRPFEGCMPIEDVIRRGPDTLRFGAFKPVGLKDPRTGREPYAVMQLRMDDRAGTLWSMVGMQTRMRHGEQTRIFKTLSGMENVEFVRLGSVHRNTFIDSPKCLDATLSFRACPGLFFAGQVTGTEGYVESTAGGLVAGINASRIVSGEEMVEFPHESAIGSLMRYISDPQRKDFQPMNISFGLMPSYTLGSTKDASGRRLSKRDRRLVASENALSAIQKLYQQL